MTALESELEGVLRASRLGPRQARAVSRRLGWDGRPPATLAAAAAGEGYTRERVRQLEQRARRYAAGLRLPAASSALELVAASAPASRNAVARELERAGIAAAPFDPAGVIVAAEMTGVAAPAVVICDDIVLSRQQAGAPQSAVSVARKLVVRNGAAHVREVARRLGMRADVVRRVLAARPETTWLTDDWLIVPARRTRATTGLRKMLSVAPALTLAEAANGLRRPGCGVSLPREVLGALCETLEWICLDASVISATVPLDPDRILSPLERALVAIFRESGPVLSFTRAVRLAEEVGINQTSAAIYLGKTPVLKSLARGLYALRGHAA